jgi:metalloendopeptidase OMA1, mitochondrial
MRRLRILLIPALALSLCYCATAPYTGRSQFIVMSAGEETAMGASAAKEVLQKEKLSRDTAKNESVRRVGRRIAAVADMPGAAWEFYVIDKDKTPNAFCLPGGKVFFYSGIFKYMQNEDQLAVVMAHEVAHAVARHGAERASRAMAAELGGAVAGAAIGAGNPAAGELFQGVYGIGANVAFILPHSREQEYEADHIGLILMAKAGYRPEAAVDFWRNMMRADKGGKPPAFLSTHPADAERIRAIQAELPEARSYQHR